jgi:hypothetical protein
MRLTSFLRMSLTPQITFTGRRRNALWAHIPKKEQHCEYVIRDKLSALVWSLMQ